MKNLVTCLLVVLMLVGKSDAQPSEEPIPFAQRDCTMSFALTMLRAASHREIRIDAPLAQGRVTIEEVLPFEALLTKILASARPRLGFRKEGDVYVVDYAEPVVSVDTTGKTVSEVLAEVFERAKLKYTTDLVEGTRSKGRFYQDLSLSDFLTAYLSGLSPAAAYQKDSVATYRIYSGGKRERAVVMQEIGHTGTVHTISHSANGRLIATSGSEGQVCVWDAVTGGGIRTFSGFCGRQAFSSSGTDIYFARGTEVVAANLRDGSLRVLGKLKRPVRHISFSPKPQVVIADDGKDLRGWTVTTGQSACREVSFTGNDTISDLSPNGNLLAISVAQQHVGDKFVISLRQLPTLNERSHFAVTGKPSSLAFSPNGSELFVGTEGGRILAYQVDQGGEAAEIVSTGVTISRGETSPFTFDGTGNYLAYQDAQHHVMLRDLVNRKTVADLSPPENSYAEVRSIALDPTAHQCYVSRSAFGLGVERVVAYDVNSGEILRKFAGGTRQIVSLQFSQDGSTMIVGDQEGIRVWDLSNVSMPQYIPGRVMALKPRSSRQESILMLGEDPDTHFLVHWVLPQGTKVPFAGEIATRNISEVKWCGDGTCLVLRAKDDRIEVWPTSGTSRSAGWDEPNRPTRKMLVNRSADRVVTLSGGQKRYIEIWNGATGYLFGSPIEIDKLADEDSVTISANADVLAYTVKGFTHLINLRTVTEMGAPLIGIQPSLNASGTRVAVRNGSKVYVYSVAEHKLEFAKEVAGTPTYGETGSLLTVFSEDRRSVSVLGSRGSIELRPTAGRIASVAAHPNGTMIATGGEDGIVRFWNLNGQNFLWSRFVGKEDFIMVRNLDNHYMATPAAAREQKFSIGNQSYPFTQFDLKYNFPEDVLTELLNQKIVPADKVQSAAEATTKRLTYLNLNRKKVQDAMEPPRQPSLAQLPPRVVRTRNLSLALDLRDPVAQLATLYISVNGVPWPSESGMSLRPEQSLTITRNIELPLSQGKNLIRIWTSNVNGASSSQLTFPVNFEPTKPKRPTLYVLSVGISKYHSDDISQFRFAADDANSIASVFKTLEQKVGLVGRRTITERVRVGRKWVVRPHTVMNQPIISGCFSKVVPIVVTDTNATREGIEKAAKHLQSSTEDDVVLIFLSGHGETHEDMEYHFLPFDTDKAHFNQTTITYNEMKHYLDGLKARQRAIILDSCQSDLPDIKVRTPIFIPKNPDLSTPKGATKKRGPSGSRDITYSRLPGQLIEPPKKEEGPKQVKESLSDSFRWMRQMFVSLEQACGANVIAGATGGATAQENEKLGHGALTKGILLGLKTRKADYNHDGMITFSELRRYLIEEVPKLTGYTQQPASRAENTDIDFVIG